MHKFISLNHQIISPEKAFLPSTSSAAFYGKSVFSTTAIYHGKPFLWEKHWGRLNDNAKKIGLDLSEISEERVKSSLLEIVEKNNIQTGRARITFFDQTLSDAWTFKPERKIGFLIVTSDLRKIKKHFNLTVSPFRVNSFSPLAGVKSGNYLEKLLILKDAKVKGFDEAVCLNERGAVVSASMANIFWVENGQIFTSPLQTGCLAGTTREFILENFAVCEKQIGIGELIKADEIFLTSSGIGIVKVRNLGDNHYLSREATENLRKFFGNAVKK